MVLAAGHLAAGANDEEGEAKAQEHHHLFHGSTHLLSSKAQWDKTKPKGRCQCYACDEREGQGQNCGHVNCSYVHGNHPSSAMFGACDDLVGLSIVKNKQTIAIAAKYPIRSAAIVISSPPVWNDAAKTEEKLCPMSQQRLGEKWNYSRPTSGSPQHSN
jgi:hypothetical protein